MTAWQMAWLILIVFSVLCTLFVVAIIAALMDFGDNPHLHGLYGNGGSESSNGIF